jgi:hypothetical protein
VSASKAKGTAWESSIVTYLKEWGGWPHIERRTLSGAKDRGDIAGLPGVVIEAKNAARIDLAGWQDEATRETANASAAVGVVWFKRRGKTSPGKGYVLMTGDQFVDLLKSAGW